MVGRLKQNLHTEETLQEHFIQSLVADAQYERRNAKLNYDPKLAMDRNLVLRFIKTNQPDAWSKLNQHYAKSAEDTFFRQLEKALKSRGLLDVLRNGLKIVLASPSHFATFVLQAIWSQSASPNTSRISCR